MTRSFRNHLMVAVAMISCVVALASCGGSAPSAQSIGNSTRPGPGDTAICQLVNKATAALNVKDYNSWHLYLNQIGGMAGSAQYPKVKQLAEEVERVATATTTTTTTRPRRGARGAGSFTFTPGLNEVIYFAGLQHACATLPPSQ
jgi:hypothetical protein